jgi:hypothetical protein
LLTVCFAHFLQNLSGQIVSNKTWYHEVWPRNLARLATRRTSSAISSWNTLSQFSTLTYKQLQAAFTSLPSWEERRNQICTVRNTPCASIEAVTSGGKLLKGIMWKVESLLQKISRIGGFEESNPSGKFGTDPHRNHRRRLSHAYHEKEIFARIAAGSLEPSQPPQQQREPAGSGRSVGT